MAVFAVVSTLNVAGLLQEVPKADTAADAAEKPLSVTRSPEGKLTTDPTSAWYVLEVTETVAAKAMATIDKSSFAAKIQLPLPMPRDSRPTLPKLCLG